MQGYYNTKAGDPKQIIFQFLESYVIILKLHL